MFEENGGISLMPFLDGSYNEKITLEKPENLK